jgi:hypothetical protein
LPLEENVYFTKAGHRKLPGSNIKSADAAVKRRVDFTPSIFDENIEAAL